MYIDNLTLLGIGAAVAVGFLVVRLMVPDAASNRAGSDDHDETGDDSRFAR